MRARGPNRKGSPPLGETNHEEPACAVPDRTPAAIHFTNGGPWFDAWQDVDFADIWRQERDMYLDDAGQIIRAGAAA